MKLSRNFRPPGLYSTYVAPRGLFKNYGLWLLLINLAFFFSLLSSLFFSKIQIGILSPLRFWISIFCTFYFSLHSGFTVNIECTFVSSVLRFSLPSTRTSLSIYINSFRVCIQCYIVQLTFWICIQCSMVQLTFWICIHCICIQCSMAHLLDLCQVLYGSAHLLDLYPVF